MNGPDDAVVIALGVLAWTLGETARADRLLALTGLDPDTLRQSAGQPELLAAVLRFLEGHEPDLVACAESLGVRPEALVRTRERLENDRHD